MPDVIDYGPTIADLERKRDEIDRTIAMLRAFAGLPAPEAAPRNGGSSGGPVEFTNKHFFGMKAPDAVLLYLETVKEARTAAKIASDLVEHGFMTTSDDPANSIRTTLRRLEADGKVVQKKKDWGLPQWYPGLRGRNGAGTETEGRKASRGAAKTRPERKSAPTRPPKAKGGGKDLSAVKKGFAAYRTFLNEQRAKGLDDAAALAAWRAHKEQAQRGE
ncbi:MAG TPA: hypothetical protein VFZ98_00080 [Vicinamibacterales bacterium]